MTLVAVLPALGSTQVSLEAELHGEQLTGCDIFVKGLNPFLGNIDWLIPDGFSIMGFHHHEACVGKLVRCYLENFEEIGMILEKTIGVPWM